MPAKQKQAPVIGKKRTKESDVSPPSPKKAKSPDALPMQNRAVFDAKDRKVSETTIKILEMTLELCGAEEKHQQLLLQTHACAFQIATIKKDIAALCENPKETKKKETEKADPCKGCRLNDHQEWLMECAHCGDRWHTLCSIPPLSEVPKEWYCAGCSV